MKLKRLASKTLATATAFSMATTLFAGVPAVPVNAATKSSNFRIEAEYGKISGAGYGPGDFSNNCSIREFSSTTKITIEGITLDEAGSRTVRLYYASGQDRPVKVSVNGGTPQTVDCNSTNSWVSKAGSTSFTANFQKGANTIVISADDYGPNLDYLTVEMTPEEEKKTLQGMIASLKGSSLGDNDIVKANALEVAFDSMSDKSDVYIKNSLTDVIRAINKNSTFTYEAELGTTDGKVVANKGSNGAMVGIDNGQSVSITVWKEKAEQTQVAVYYAVAADHRYVACTADGTETVFDKCTAERTDLYQDGDDNLPWSVPNSQPVSKKVSLKAGENTLTFAFPKNTSGLELSNDQNKYAPNLDKFQIELTPKEEAETIKLMAKNGASPSGLERAFLSISADAKELLAAETSLSSSLNSLVKDWSGNKTDTFGEKLATYKVTFDTDGGTEVEPQVVEEGKFAEAPETEKDGYDFVEWVKADGKAFDFEKDAITADITLKAKWALNVEGAAKEFDNVMVNMPNEADKDYYDQDLWQKVQDKIAEIESVINAEADAYEPQAAVDLIQKLTKELEDLMMDLVASKSEDNAVRTVTFDPANGEASTTVEVKKGDFVDDAYIPTAEKEGYKLEGWSYGEDKTTPFKFDKVAIVEDMLFTAIWNLDLEYSLGKYEDEINKLPNKDDYTEESWKAVQDILEKLAAEKELGEAANAATINDLLAQLQEALDKLEKATFEVTFDSKGGTAVDAQQVVKGETAKEPENNPTKNNYDFKGWFLGNEKYDFSTPVTAPITLTAQWEKSSAVVDLENKFNELKDQFSKLEAGKYDQSTYTSTQEIIKQIQDELAKPNPDYNKIQTLLGQLNIALTSGLKEIPQTAVETKVTGITLTADPSTKIAAGKKVQIDAEVSPSNATTKTLTWESSNTSYATVDANGLVTTKAAGKGKSVVITAKAADGSGIQKTVTIKIMKKAVKKIKLTASTNSVTAGKKVTVKATVTPKAKASQINAKLQWVSSNTKFATVNSKGVVKTLKKGKGKTVKITAMSTDGTKKKATFKIKIK